MSIVSSTSYILIYNFVSLYFLQYLQPPDPKTAKSRGSWPGVGIGRNLGRMPNEISRSEQHLTSESISVTSSHAITKCSSAKTSSPIERASENEGKLIFSNCLKLNISQKVT